MRWKGRSVAVAIIISLSSVLPTLTTTRCQAWGSVVRIPYTVVRIPDPGLEAALRWGLSLALDRQIVDITVEDMGELHNLDARSRGIRSLTGLEHATNLFNLSLGTNNVSDLAPIARLSKLQWLDLQVNQIADLPPLAELVSLEMLYVQENKLRNVSGLAGATKLRKLDLHENNIDNLSPLEELTALEELDLGANRVNDLSSIAGLNRLQRLCLDGNQIDDLSPLAGLTNLTWLSIRDNQVTDLSPLAALARLQCLDLHNNQISDISPLARLTELRQLRLDQNQISNISALMVNSEAGGLGQGDVVELRDNCLDLWEESQTMIQIDALIERGVEVHYEAQEGLMPALVPTDSNVSATVTRIWKHFPLAYEAGEQSLVKPYAVCQDSSGRFFVLDLGKSEGVDTTDIAIYVLNRKRQIEAIIGNTPNATVRTPQISNPGDIAVDSRGRLYVCDHRRGVHVLDSNLTYLGCTVIPQDGTGGYPSCIAVDSKDRLIVGQWRVFGYSRFLVYSLNQTDPTAGSMVLERILELCPPGENCAGRHGTPMDITVDPQGRVIIAEGREQYIYIERMVVLDENLDWLMSLGSYCTAERRKNMEPGCFWGIVSAIVEPSGVFIVADGGSCTISFFLQDGSFGGRIGRKGSQPGEFSGMGDLLVTESGSLLVPDFRNGWIQEIAVDVSSLHPIKPVSEISAFSLAVVSTVCSQLIRRSRLPQAIRSLRRIHHASCGATCSLT